MRCFLNVKKCEPATGIQSYRQPFSEFIKSDSPKLQSGCYATESRWVFNSVDSHAFFSRFVEEATCADIKDCEECVGRKRCGWCTTTHSCINAGSGCLDDLTSDRRSCNAIMKKSEKQVSERPCGLATNCYACRRMSHCVWLTVDTKRVCVSKSDHGKYCIFRSFRFIDFSANPWTTQPTIGSRTSPLRRSTFHRSTQPFSIAVVASFFRRTFHKRQLVEPVQRTTFKLWSNQCFQCNSRTVSGCLCQFQQVLWMHKSAVHVSCLKKHV